jgi:hypothetical protein
MRRRAVKTKHAPCRRPVRRVCRASLGQRIATQRSNRAQAAAVEESSHKYDWSLVERRRFGVSSSRSRCCSENGVRRESVAGGRSFKPGPPSRRACVSSTRLESGTRAALIPSMPAHRTAFSCRQNQDETPRWKWKGKRKRETTNHHDGLMCLAEGSARFALPGGPSTPAPRSGAPAISTSNGSQSNQGFRGTGFGDAARSSKLLSNVVRFFLHPPRFSDRSAVAWPFLREHALGSAMPSRQNPQ